MIELVVPDVLADDDRLNDDRLTLTREMVGRQVLSFDGSRAEALELAEQVSGAAQGAPVLVNDVTDETDTHRIVDVYVHQGGRRLSVSEGVERPRGN